MCKKRTVSAGLKRHLAVMLFGFAALCLPVVSAAGEGDSVNVFGVLEVFSRSTNTIVSVPWVDLAPGADRDIRVCDLVLTNNLSEGDTISVYDLDRREVDNYTSWTLGKDGWESVITVSQNDLNVSPEAESTGVSRGRAFWLSRQRPTNGTEPVPFYLCGQYTTNAAQRVVINPGTTNAPVYHLVASPDSQDKYLNDYVWNAASINDNDTIEVPMNDAKGARTIHWFDRAAGKWGYWGYVGRKKSMIYTTKLNAGTGFWYISCGGRMTIRW